mmetsp:Transcript_66648/g.104176  ORF Transcript_66648/g.104176 Transcript_66648/m.104176 type:complete len:1210 (+) Transcript_66648:73-3702(+)
MTSSWEHRQDALWEVIGGASKGGLIVRHGEDKSSEEATERLSTGSIIRVLEKTDTRVRYELLSGEGPQSGWVNTRFNGKDLLTQLQELAINLEEEALRGYCLHFGEQPQQEIWENQHQSTLMPNFRKKSIEWNKQSYAWGNSQKQALESGDLSKNLSKDQVQHELEQGLGLKRGALKSRKDIMPHDSLKNQIKDGWAEDSDGDEVCICQHCNLPLGDIAYSHGDLCVHGECAAHLVAQELKSQEDARVQSERDRKRQQRAEYDIGWTAKRIPRNDVSASKLAMREIPQGMSCLVFDEEEHAISVASTIEPAAAVNLEYLSIALQVRRQEGHEPVFSLDPVDATDKKSMQEKVFVPAWLAGTSVGEVLFQADYHLKELSMGEYEQPVVGMASCFEHAEIDSRLVWNAREWFMVRKAEVQLSEGNMLIPMVKMGVEAREQTLNGKGLEDIPVTCADHPMVKYAASFTKNFDLIAERRSVIYHLRELAKASVLAKFLLDAEVQLEEAWFSLGGVISDTCCLQVPQLWSERVHSQVQVGEGRSIEAPDAWGHSVYGGVQFGLEKFSLVTSVSSRQSSLTVPQILQKLSWSSVSERPAASISGVPTFPRKQQAAAPITILGPGNYPPKPIFKASTMEGVQFLPPSAGISAFSRRDIVTEVAAALPLSRITTQARIQAPLSLALPAPPPPEQIPLSLVGRPPPIAEPARPGAPSLLATISPAPDTPGVRQVIDRDKMSTLIPYEASAYAAGIGIMAAPSLSGVDPSNLSAFSYPERALRTPLARRAQLRTGLSHMVPTRLGAGSVAELQFQGVDLRLDSFDLSSTTRVAPEERVGTCLSEFGPLDDCVAIADAFWSSLDASANYLKNQDQALLREVFKPTLTDRRSDGDLFIPPDTSFSYVEKLRQLVKEEEIIRNHRKEHFFSKSFLKGDPSSLFPQSWTSSIDVARGRVPVPHFEDRPESTLHSRPELVEEVGNVLQHASKSFSPIFDRSTEEGMRFRIYSLGSLEIRTVQEPSSEECVGAVFSIRNEIVNRDSDQSDVDEAQVIVKITEYVERAFEAGRSANGLHRRFYIVLETDHGDRIMTERLRDGHMNWRENPEDLEDRNSLAKVMRMEVCKAGVTLKDMRASQGKWAEAGSTPSGKRYARAVFNKAVGSRTVDPSTRNITMGLPFMKKFRQKQAESRVEHQMPFEKALRSRPQRQGNGLYTTLPMYFA